MKVYYKYDGAKRVLDFIIKKLRGLSIPSSSRMEIVVSCYQNGRENGFSVKFYPNAESLSSNRSVTFSENRNSDQIVVYLDDNSNQGLSDKGYESRKFFPWNGFEKAADYCVKHLTSP
jgi:hypothetical protein